MLKLYAYKTKTCNAGSKEIQKRLNSNKGNMKKVDADQKAFAKLMLHGKVRKLLRELIMRTPSKEYTS